MINLIKSIEKIAEDSSDDPYLIGLAERARAVKENFEDRQITTQEALDKLFKEIEENESRKKKQAEKGLDGLTYFIYSTLEDSGIKDSEPVSKKIKSAFSEHPNWLTSEADHRVVHKKITYALCAVENDLDTIASLVNQLITLLQNAKRCENV